MATTTITPTQMHTQDYFNRALATLIEQNPKINKFALPKIVKVVINTGVGKFDNKQKQEVTDYIEKLTGQIPKKVLSRVSISSFKVRKGDVVGAMTTLRGKKAQDFVFQLIYVALPRTRDFKGIKGSSFDNKFSCYTIGIDNASIFPAIGFDIQYNFGMQINISFEHPTPENVNLLKSLTFPFKK